MPLVPPGVRRICLIEEPVAAAIGAGVDIAKPHGVFVVDIGCGTTDMAVMSLSGVAVSQSIKTAGDVFDDHIIRYVRRKYNLIIGKRMAEQAKMEAGCVYPQEETLTCRVKGRNALSGLPQWVDITGEEMLEALLEPAMEIVQAVQNTLESHAAGTDERCVRRRYVPDRWFGPAARFCYAFA